MIVSGDYTPAATLDMLMKDVDLFLSAAHGMGLSLPMGELVKNAYQSAADHGLGGKDFFVLVEEAERTAGGAAP